MPSGQEKDWACSKARAARTGVHLVKIFNRLLNLHLLKYDVVSHLFKRLFNPGIFLLDQLLLLLHFCIVLRL